MENHTPAKEHETSNSSKKWIIILGILSGFFFLTTLYFAFMGSPSQKTELTQTVEERNALQSELDALLIEHDKIKLEYGDLAEQLSEKDSVIIANAEEIKKLLSTTSDYNQIKRQMARLQNIAKEYVAEMDKLHQENQVLKEENTQVKESLAQEQAKVVTVEKNNKDLSDKISVASVLKVYNIHGRAVSVKARNNVESITEKANKANRFKTSFIIGENSLMDPGPVNVYCRIAIPETGRVLTPGAGDAYTFGYNGTKLQYTAKTTINYTGKEESVILYWDIRKDDSAAKGKYVIEIYSDNLLLGETYFILD